MLDPARALPPDSPAAFALERGRSRRRVVPRRDHAAWAPAPGRLDPVDAMRATNEGRIPELVPIRVGRMLVSPFAFLRGSAAVMAADLAGTPTMGSTAQLCGDAHIANFGVYASPERRLVFDLNDFDETCRGPWEWDLKRLAASLVVASRENGFPEDVCRDIGRSAGREYRRWIRTYASMRALQVWYAAIPIEHILERVEEARTAAAEHLGLDFSIEDAQRKDHLAALGKLSTKVHGGYLIRDRPPLIVRLPEDDPGREAFPHLYRAYLRSLRPDRRILVAKHRVLDIALKVVGVGSVGTHCYVVMFAGPAGGPLILQVKEARDSVLAPYVRGRRYRHQGERVVTGQRIMQALSDSFLGWTKSPVSGTEYYVRQLHDMKYGFDIAGLRAPGMRLYGEVCAWALARAHARSGNPAEIAGYLGRGARFDDALASFAVAYADQTERDHAALVAAVRAGRLEAQTGIDASARLSAAGASATVTIRLPTSVRRSVHDQQHGGDTMANHSGRGTKADPWVLKTPPGTSEYQMYLDDANDPPAIICQVGGTQLKYDRRAIDDLHAMLKAHGDWMPLGGADEQKPAPEGTVEAWGRSADNPVGGWYGLKKGLRGRFGVYMPPLMEALGLAEVTHDAKNNKMRAI